MPDRSTCLNPDAAGARRRSLGAAIRQARGEITQTRFAEMLGICQPALSAWESGKVALSLDKVLAIEWALGLAAGDLARRAGYISPEG